MDITINGATESWIKGTTPSSGIPKFWTLCPFCAVRYRLHRGFLNKLTSCQSCNREFTALESSLQGLTPGKNSFEDITKKRILIKMLRELQLRYPVASDCCRSSFWTMCRNCECRYHYMKLYIDKWFVCHSCKEENIAMELLARSGEGEVRFNKYFQDLKRCLSKKEISPGLTCAVNVGEKRKRNEYGESCSAENRSVVVHNDRRGEESVQPKISEGAGLKFNDFDKLREEVNFAVGQTWALYDPADGMPRKYALIQKVSVTSFRLRITYLEPDPDGEKEIQWFEEDLPVSAGKFRLGNSQNTKDRSMFSHVIHCNKGINTGHFTVSPRKGETWALFKNWDITWSSEPDSHRKFEYEFVEILSDYSDGAGVSVVLLHKAKGFASVFFRMGTGDADISQILPHNLYHFSHRIPSFKMTGVKGKDLPKEAYELDQAALPETIEDIIVPFHLLAKLTAPKPKPEVPCFTRNGKFFQTGQIWAFSGCYDDMPRYYCRIWKITLTQEDYKLHVNRLKATRSQENVIQWEDKKMPVGCGTFLVTKGFLVFTPGNVSHQIVPQISMDGNEYTILPKIGQVWVIYRSWSPHIGVYDLDGNVDFDIVEVLDDALDFKVLALVREVFANEEKNKYFSAAESRPCYSGDDGDGSEVTFTILKSKMLRFSHQVPASRVTKEIDGKLKELFEVDKRALPPSSDY